MSFMILQLPSSCSIGVLGKRIEVKRRIYWELCTFLIDFFVLYHTTIASIEIATLTCFSVLFAFFSFVFVWVLVDWFCISHLLQVPISSSSFSHTKVLPVSLFILSKEGEQYNYVIVNMNFYLLPQVLLNVNLLCPCEFKIIANKLRFAGN